MTHSTMPEAVPWHERQEESWLPQPGEDNAWAIGEEKIVSDTLVVKVNEAVEEQVSKLLMQMVETNRLQPKVHECVCNLSLLYLSKQLPFRSLNVLTNADTWRHKSRGAESASRPFTACLSTRRSLARRGLASLGATKSRLRSR